MTHIPHLDRRPREQRSPEPCIECGGAVDVENMETLRCGCEHFPCLDDECRRMDNGQSYIECRSCALSA